MNYSELTQQIQDLTEDDSAEFVSDIPNQIRAAENRIFRYVQDLLSVRTESTGSLVSGTETLVKPSGLIRIRSLSITVASSSKFLDRRTDQYLLDYWPNPSSTSEPKFYAEIDENNILLAPTPDSGYSYSLKYIAKPAGLSESNVTTWVSENAENALLYACMREANLFLEYPELAQDWDNKFKEEIELLQGEVIRTFKTDYGA